VVSSSRWTAEAEEMDELKKNPYFAKYADKLKKAQDSDPNQFDAKLDEMERKRREEEADKRRQREEKLAEARKQAAQRKLQSLESVMKMDLLKDRTVEEITHIWGEFHKNKNFIFAAIPATDWKAMANRAAQFPTFLYPLPRQNGFEFFVQQFDGNECHITPLLAFQTHKENAPPCMTMIHYPDLMDSKGIVLMRGEPDPNFLNIHEAQLLALQVKMYYSEEIGDKHDLIEKFNKEPDKFHHMELVKEFETFRAEHEKAKTEEVD